jgi:hypothetical protein
MTIHVELNPEVERQFVAKALARGIALELYAQQLLQEAMASNYTPSDTAKPHAEQPMPGVECESALVSRLVSGREFTRAAIGSPII